MDIQYVHIPNAKLSEGEVYPFRILKTISLGPNDDYYVLEDPNNYKIMLPKAYYDGYGFETGKIIQCRVDKINCNGRVFLEPVHPVYQEGQIYSFDFVCKDHLKNILDEDEYYFIVRDTLQKTWKVRIHSKEIWESPPIQISCLLVKIKKGKLFLRASEERQPSSEMAVGKPYLFRILDERYDTTRKAAYYVLSDAHGSRHMLKKKHFIRYALKKGSTIKCLVRQVAADGYLILEPEHPCYVAGKSYQFPLDRLEEMVFTDGFKQKVLVLKDCFGEEIRLHMNDRSAQLLSNKRYVQAKVKRLVKGKPELEVSNEQPI